MTNPEEEIVVLLNGSRILNKKTGASLDIYKNKVVYGRDHNVFIFCDQQVRFIVGEKEYILEPEQIIKIGEVVFRTILYVDFSFIDDEKIKAVFIKILAGKEPYEIIIGSHLFRGLALSAIKKENQN